MSLSTENFDSEVTAVRAFAGRSLDGLTVNEFADLRHAVSHTKRSFDAVVAAVAGEAAPRSVDPTRTPRIGGRRTSTP